MTLPIGDELPPLILDLDSDQSTLQLILSDSDDELRLKKKPKAKSWHGNIQASKINGWQEICSCRAEDFKQLKSAKSNISITSSTKSAISMKSEIILHRRDNLINVKNNLEIMLSTAVAKEMELSEHHRLYYEKYNKLELLLEGLDNYLDLLDMEQRGCVRLSTLLDNYMSTGKLKSTMYEKLLKNIQYKAFNYQPMKNRISRTLCTSKELENLIFDYKDKKKDFNTAIHNFRIILDSNFNVGQMRKLKKQFEGIVTKFQHSWFMLDKKLPEVINKRMSVLLNCSEYLGEELQKIANERSDFSLLFQHLESALRVQGDNEARV